MRRASKWELPLELAPELAHRILSRAGQKWRMEEVVSEIHGAFFLEALRRRTEFTGDILKIQFARRLLWMQGKQVFRVAEDGSYANIDDEIVELDGWMVRPVKATELEESERRKWGGVFTDYEIFWMRGDDM